MVAGDGWLRQIRAKVSRSVLLVMRGQGLVEVSKPGDTRAILNAALASLGRPAIE
jgi:hypothetical protein